MEPSWSSKRVGHVPQGVGGGGGMQKAFVSEGRGEVLLWLEAEPNLIHVETFGACAG